MTDNIEITQLTSKEQKQDFVHLHNNILSSVDMPWFKWKFENNPIYQKWGDGNCPVIGAYDGEKIVGGIGDMPIEFVFNNRCFVGSSPADYMVRPEYRDSNIFIRLVNAWKDLNINSDLEYAGFGGEIDIVWSTLRDFEGISLDRSHRIQRPVAMFDQSDNAPKYVRLLDIFLKNIMKANDALFLQNNQSVNVKVIDGVPADELNELYERNKPSEFHAKRSNEYLAWRYNNPKVDNKTLVAKKDGELKGAVITEIKEGKFVIIQDVLPLPLSRISDEVKLTLLNNLMDVFQKNPSITAPISVRREWWRAGFWQTDLIEAIPDRFIPDDFNSIYSTKQGIGWRWNSKEDHEKYPSPDKWLLMGFEND